MKEYRKTINELRSLYKLENVKDIFVEGPFDNLFISEFLRLRNISDVFVYPIESIEIEDSILDKHHIERQGNRSRVIALAYEFNFIPPPAATINCIVDRDLESYFGVKHETARLLYTDFTSIDLYFYNNEVFDKFLRLFLRDNSKITVFMKKIESILLDLFAIRLVVAQKKLEFTWIEPYRLFKFDKENIIFLSEQFIERLLNSNSSAKIKNDFLKDWVGIRKKLDMDPRHSIHKDDLLCFLGWYVNTKHNSKRFNENKHILDMLLGFLNFETMNQYNLFQELELRLQT